MPFIEVSFADPRKPYGVVVDTTCKAVQQGEVVTVKRGHPAHGLHTICTLEGEIVASLDPQRIERESMGQRQRYHVLEE